MTLFGRLTALVDELPHVVVLLLCLALVAGVGMIDLLTGAGVVFSVFYAVPIALATWVLGRTSGILFSVAATILWTVGDRYSLDQTWTSGVPWWNAAVRLAFFAMVVLILAALKQALGEEQRLPRADALTRVPNVRRFREQADLELRRAQRSGQPLNVAIFDVEGLLRHADALMYEVKSAGKDGVRTAVLGAGADAPVRSSASRASRIVST